MFCPPAVWDNILEELFYLNRPAPNVQPYRHIQWVIKENNHWILAEAYRLNGQVLFFLTSEPQSAGRLLPLIQHLRAALGGNNQSFVLHCRSHPNIPGMCGHLVIAEIYNRIGIAIPPLSHSQEAELASSPHTDRLMATLHRASHAWTQVNASPQLQTFAQVLRRWLLLRISRNMSPPQTTAAGAQDAMEVTSPKQAPNPSQPSSGPPAGKQDPVWLNDPWKKSAKTSQARWEDLQLQAPIPFFGTDTKPMLQTHRLQVSQARAGVVLTTKQHIAELLKFADKLDLALLVPTIDGSKPPNVYQTFEGPFEITVEDPVTKSVYKRLVLMLPAKGKVTFRLPEPKLKLHTAAIAEIVVELDSRLVPRAEFEHMKDHPLQSFKNQIATLLPDFESTLTLYGLRTTKHPGAHKSEIQLQCMVKAPFAARTPILEASGQAYLLFRDYIDHSNEPLDTTVLPRFWETTTADLAAMRITTKGIPGAAGIVATRRGLALRIWTKHSSSTTRTTTKRWPPHRRQSSCGSSVDISGFRVACRNRACQCSQISS